VSRKGPATLTQVAEQAGVSLATASRVLNGSARVVGEPLRSRVLAVAEELGYRPNALAQATARGSSNLVGLVVHDVADPYFSAIADGVIRTAEERGLVVVLGATRRDPDQELRYVSTLRSQRARAVILAGSRTTDADRTELLVKELEGFRAGGGRVAIVSQNRLGVHTVQAQNRAGARDLATALCRLGHRRFTVLAGPKQLITSSERLSGFVKGATSRGVNRDDIDVLHGDFTRDGGFALGQRFLDTGRASTCVFATNDVMAVGAVAALRQAGVRVPEDVSVAGFDDIATLRDMSPPLTTVSLPLEEMGARAAELALDSDPDGAPKVVPYRGEVILRASTQSLA
jgi:LacI family transcriptional regulator